MSVSIAVQRFLDFVSYAEDFLLNPVFQFVGVVFVVIYAYYWILWFFNHKRYIK